MLLGCDRGRKVLSKGKKVVGEVPKGRGCPCEGGRISAQGSGSKMAEEFFHPLRIDICARASSCHFMWLSVERLYFLF